MASTNKKASKASQTNPKPLPPPPAATAAAGDAASSPPRTRQMSKGTGSEKLPLGILLTQLREQRGRTQQELAGLAGVHVATVMNCEGHRPSKADTIKAIYFTPLGLSPDEQMHVLALWALSMFDIKSFKPESLVATMNDATADPSSLARSVAATMRQMTSEQRQEFVEISKKLITHPALWKVFRSILALIRP